MKEGFSVRMIMLTRARRVHAIRRLVTKSFCKSSIVRGQRWCRAGQLGGRMIAPVRTYGSDLGDLVFASGLFDMGARTWVVIRLTIVVVCMVSRLRAAWVEQQRAPEAGISAPDPRSRDRVDK